MGLAALLAGVRVPICQSVRPDDPRGFDETLAGHYSPGEKTNG